MNSVIKAFRIFSLCIFYWITCLQVSAADFPGTWSNEKNEFKTIALMLRADGQAVFGVSVISSYAKWAKSKDGLLLTVGSGGESLDIPFVYDPATEMLTGKLRDTELILKKVSAQEPPDLLAIAKSNETAELARFNASNHVEERSLVGREALSAFLKQWIAELDLKKRGEYLFLSTDENEARLSVSGSTQQCNFEINLEYRSIETPTGYPLESKNLKANAVSNLPLIYELKPQVRAALTELTQMTKVKSETFAFSQVSAFKTEKFWRNLHLSISSSDDSDALSLTERILDLIWETPPKTIHVSIQYRDTSSPTH